jgi:serine/threonine protein kinase
MHHAVSTTIRTLALHSIKLMNSTLTGYELLELLGQGGMGQVYAAKDIGLQRVVAVKMLHDSRDPELLRRFEAEVKSIASLSHPNITRLYEYAKTEAGQPYCVLEYISGGSLADRMKGNLASPKLAAQIVATLASAIQVAHDQGILHRDLKPSNILIDDDDGRTSSLAASDADANANEPIAETIKNVHAEASTKSPLGIFRMVDRHARTDGIATIGLHIRPSQLRIADFGLARRIDEDSRMTRTGQIIGTPAYMAPEQASGMTTKPGPSVDIYSLGAILYELLTGRPPFLGADCVETLMLLMSEELVPPRVLQPTIPLNLSTICCKCLEKKASRRYASATELADDLHRFVQGKPILAKRATLWEKSMRWTVRNPWKAASIGLLAATFIASLIGSQVLRSAYAEARRVNSQLTETNTTLAKTNQDLETTLGLAKESLDRVTIQLRDELYDVPNTRPIMMNTAASALAVQRKLYEVKPRDQELARAYVNAIYENEMLQWFYGDKKQCPLLLNELDHALETVTADFPKDVSLKVLQVKAILERGSIEPNAELSLQAARQKEVNDRLAIMLADHPDSAEVLRLALMVYSKNASAAERANDFDAQLQVATALVPLAEKHLSVETRPTEKQIALVWLADARKTLAQALHRFGRTDEARAQLERAIADLQATFDRAESETYRRKLAELHFELGMAQAMLDRNIDAAQALSRAADLYGGLAKDYPDEWAYLNSSAEALMQGAQWRSSISALRLQKRNWGWPSFN